MNGWIARRRELTEEGQTMAEYAVVLGIITIVIVTTFGLLSQSVADLFDRVAGLFS
jgi:Flp pilus assembly pilin Flp